MNYKEPGVCQTNCRLGNAGAIDVVVKDLLHDIKINLKYCIQ